MTTSKSFSVIARENASNLLPPSLIINLEEQLCTRKNEKSIRENKENPNNDKKSDKPNEDLSKRNNDSSKKVSGKKEKKEKKFSQPRDVTVILGDCMIKNEKG